MANNDPVPRRPLPHSLTRLQHDPLSFQDLGYAPPDPGLTPGASDAEYFAALDRFDARLTSFQELLDVIASTPRHSRRTRKRRL
jgi:hypothetical protein